MHNQAQPLLHFYKFETPDLTLSRGRLLIGQVYTCFTAIPQKEPSLEL